MKNILIICLIICSFSCRKKATIELPKSEIKLVVSCFITPDDSLITAVVRSSTPKFSAGSFGNVSPGSDVTDALVILSDETSQITMLFDQMREAYVADAKLFPIVPGKTYYLSVSTPDGKKVNAMTTVPVNRLSISSFETSLNAENTMNQSIIMNISVADIKNEINYVELYYRTIFVAQGNPNFPQGDTIYSLFNIPAFSTDENTAKETYNFREEYYMGGEEHKALWVEAAVLNCNKDFFLYHQSIYPAVFSSGDPFANPALVYSNINNGFGCFGAYLSTIQRKQVK